MISRRSFHPLLVIGTIAASMLILSPQPVAADDISVTVTPLNAPTEPFLDTPTATHFVDYTITNLNAFAIQITELVDPALTGGMKDNPAADIVNNVHLTFPAKNACAVGLMLKGKAGGMVSSCDLGIAFTTTDPTSENDKDFNTYNISLFVKSKNPAKGAPNGGILPVGQNTISVMVIDPGAKVPEPPVLFLLGTGFLALALGGRKILQR
jgi:hypothetical protein